jgi:hypothetical protein
MTLFTTRRDRATIRGALRLAVGTLIALPTTMAFLGLSVVVVLGRSVAGLGMPAETSSRW